MGKVPQTFGGRCDEKAELRTIRLWPGKLRQTLVKAMTYILNNVGMVSIEDSRRILRAIFPN